jgi:hypothetical protein
VALRHALLAALAFLFTGPPAGAQIESPAIVIGVTPVTRGTAGNCLQVDLTGRLVTQGACGGGSSITVGVSAIVGGSTNQILYDNAGLLGEVLSGNNGVLVTSGIGVPSISSTLPVAVQANITGTGTLTSGSTGAGFTLNFATTGTSGSLAPGGGGTGTTTAFTTGSVVFAGAAGAYTQDNANFFYDATNHILGLGTATPFGANANLPGHVVAGNTNGNLRLSLSNANSGASAGSQFFLSTGTVNNTASLLLLDTAHTVTLSGGAALTGGVIINSGAASAPVVFQINAVEAGRFNSSGNLTLANVSGSTQCLHASSAGVVTGTGSDCSSASAQLTFPQGRLTLTSGTPVLATSVVSGTTLYYDCFIGNQVPYNSGSFGSPSIAVDTIASCEVSTAMVSAASAGQVVGAVPPVANNIYDVWWEGNTHHNICLAMSSSSGGGGGWGSDTGSPTTSTRGTGYSQLDTSGAATAFISNKNAITNCFNGSTNYGSIAASRATYLGTIYANANGAISVVFDAAAASGGNGSIIGVSNGNNRKSLCALNRDSNSSWSYALGTWRQFDGANGTLKNYVIWVDGLQRGDVTASLVAVAFSTTNASLFGFNLDSTSATPSPQGIAPISSGTPVSVNTAFSPQLGVHTVYAMEAANGGSTFTVYGTGWGGNSGQVNHMKVCVEY